MITPSLITDAQRLIPTVAWPLEATVLIAAICQQESDGQNVQQTSAGPAKGYPQFEVEAIRELLENRASSAAAIRAIRASGILGDTNENQSHLGDVSGPSNVSGGEDGGVPLDSASRLAAVVWTKFLNFPALQIALARLMLWDNPKPLPALGDCNGAWTYYNETWRPGRPRPDAWPVNYREALSEFAGE